MLLAFASQIYAGPVTGEPEPWSALIANLISTGDPCNLFPDFGSNSSCQNPRGAEDEAGEGGDRHLPFPRDNKLSRENLQLLIQSCLASSPVHPCGVCHPLLLQACSHLSRMSQTVPCAVADESTRRRRFW